MVIGDIVVTTPARATVDMLRSLWRPHAMAAGDAMAHAGLVSREEIMARIAPMKRYPGIIQARALAQLIEPLTESPGESWTRLALVDSGLPLPSAQLEVYDRFGRLLARLDLAYRKAKVGVEFDGREFHTDEEALRHDAARRALLTETLQWKLAIVTYERIFGDHPRFEEQVAEWLGLPIRPRGW